MARNYAIPLVRYPRNPLIFITYLLKLVGVLHRPYQNLEGKQYSHHIAIISHTMKQDIFKYACSMLNITCPTY
jgi:hypothetical protein